MKEWISINDKLPREGELVLTFRPEAQETQDPVICLATYKKDRNNMSPQNVSHNFSCWCHPTYWAEIPDPTDKMIFPDSTNEGVN